MNLYIVVEGKVEKFVYQNWIPKVNSTLTYVESIDNINNNNFYIISGGGYPSYFEIINNAIEDVKLLKNVDRLVIAVDSEDMKRIEKINEIEDFLKDKNCITEIKIIVQHFCLETWALGNKKIVSQSSRAERLSEYLNFFNVRTRDPEELPPYLVERLNRAQFAKRYLRLLLKEKNQKLTYTKKDGVLVQPQFYERVRSRFENDKHIQSFRDFLEAFLF